MNNVTETVLAFRIIRHEDPTPAHRAAMMEKGINPDDNWSLIWSFDNRADAEEQLAECQEDAAEWQTFKIIEGVREERPVVNWF